MLLRVVVYSKEMEVKLMLYDYDPNNARMRMKYITFRSMNPMYGRERNFSKSTLNNNATHNFLSNVNANNHLSKDNALCVFFKYFNNLNNLIFKVF